MNNEAKHTPGPWLTFICRENEIQSLCIETDFERVCGRVQEWTDYGGYGSRLVVLPMIHVFAAQDMLEALKVLLVEREACEALLADWDPGHISEGPPSPGTTMARAAIAKAEGAA